ncbi:MAG: class I SAM-dependent methyltransferase [Elusimicrobia bacterium]|nr:class I SAM-dependent methyltransferase [Elusimicrobiota bacterium]
MNDDAQRGIGRELDRLSVLSQDDNGMISREDGRLLKLLAETRGARSAIEIGCGVGFSTLHLACGLLRTGGRLAGWEGVETKARDCREAVARAGLGGVVTVRQEDFLDAELAPDQRYDLVFLDAMKTDTLLYFDRLMPLLETGGLIIAHDALGGENVKMRDYLDMLKGHPCLDTVFVSSEYRVGAQAHRGGAGMAVSRKTSPELDDVKSWGRRRAAAEIAARREPGTAARMRHWPELEYVDDYGGRGVLLVVPPAPSKDELLLLCRALLETRPRDASVNIHVYDEPDAAANRDNFHYPAGEYFDHLVAQIFRHPRLDRDEIRYFPEGVTLLLEKPETDPVSPSARYGRSPHASPAAGAAA